MWTPTRAIVLIIGVAGLARGEPPAPTDALARLPYRIAAHVAIAPEARIDARARDRLLGAWRGLVQRFIGAPWELTIAEGDHAVLGVELESLEPSALAEIAHDHDKIWLIQLGRAGADWTLTGRELDTATMRLGPTHHRPARFAADLPRALLDLAQVLFRPTAVIDEQSGGGVTLTVRAAALRAASPVGHFVKAGTVFRPIRKVSLPDGGERVLDIPFTYLRVESLEEPTARCTIISALRDPLTRRIAQKSTLVALGSAPGPYPTRLRFVTAPEKAPAAGYLLTGRLVPDGQARDLGTTDREGRVVLPAGSSDGLLALRLLAGSVEPLVEFPLMPGESSRERDDSPFDPHTLTVTLETQLDSLRDTVMDVVATRARLEARLKARLEGEDWAGMEAALQEFNRLPPRETFTAQLAKLKEDSALEQARTKTAILTKTAQAQVAELDGLIARYLDDDSFRAYSDALAKARSDAAREKAPKAKKPSADRPRPIISEGASLSEPAGWTRLVPDKPGRIGSFISPDSTATAPVLMIKIDVGRPTDVNLQSTADHMARNWGGRVLEEKTSLDGVEAMHVRVEQPGPGLRPIEGVFGLKNGRLYLLMGGAVPGRSVADQVEEVRRSWRWVK